MKITESKVRKLLIEEVERLDPVTVYLEDFEPGQGKITIECFGQSWSSYWGAMRGHTVAQFFCSCDESYLSNCLAGNLPSNTTDDEKAWEFIKWEIDKAKQNDQLDYRGSILAMNEIERFESADEWMQSGSELVQRLFGPDWRFTCLPMKANQDYVYLCRVIDTVKSALKETNFKQWLTELDEYSKSIGWLDNLSEQTGADSWRDYFNQGMSPEEAVSEDLSYADWEPTT